MIEEAISDQSQFSLLDERSIVSYFMFLLATKSRTYLLVSITRYVFSIAVTIGC